MKQCHLMTLLSISKKAFSAIGMNSQFQSGKCFKNPLIIVFIALKRMAVLL